MPDDNTVLFNVARPTPPTTSYWCGASREELARCVAERRHQMEMPTLKDVRFDPAIAATVSLADAKAYHKAQRERP